MLVWEYTLVNKIVRVFVFVGVEEIDNDSRVGREGVLDKVVFK